MALRYHPKQGSLVLVRFDHAFKPPEMVKSRPCVVISKRMKSRPNLATVVPLSTTAPQQVMPYHCEISIDLELPKRWSSPTCWVKADMIYSLSFERMDLFRIGKGPDGRRIYQTDTVSDDTFEKISQCVKAGLGL
ncbi:type II toxin-antitoxin system PemK/MazF family toxin [Shimia sp.]|uniref:type II toxin-antitoxin system PemK/MazF family toxin n=1 Tax=Shimia sp. TaxID=1954381 RepID=UPI003BAC73DB